MNSLLLAVWMSIAGFVGLETIDRFDRLLDRMQQLEERIDALETENAALRARVEQLEAVVLANHHGQPLDEENPPNDSVAQLLRVQPMPHDEDMLREAEQLEAEAEEFEAKNRQLTQEIGELERRTPPRHLRGNARRQWIETERVRRNKERRELRRLATDKRAQARQRIGQANRLRREATATRQIIHAWDGERTLIMETLRDLSRRLDDVDQSGGYFTWDGSLVEVMEDASRYTVRRIEPISRPSDSFKPYPD